jgi:hypothetical protein
MFTTYVLAEFSTDVTVFILNILVSHILNSEKTMLDI